eukprot:3059316-Rhodomonas_salina.7
MPGSDIGHGVSLYVFAMRCPVLTFRLRLPACCARKLTASGSSCRHNPAMCMLCDGQCSQRLCHAQEEQSARQKAAQVIAEFERDKAEANATVTRANEAVDDAVEQCTRTLRSAVE